MTRRIHQIATAGALAILLTACSSDTPGSLASQAPTQSQAPAAASPTSAPEASSTLSTEKQEAFGQARAAVVAFRQTGLDLYTGARTNRNDLNDVVAAGDLLDRELRNVSQGLSQGYRSEPRGAKLQLVSAEPVKIDLQAEPPTVVVRACIDMTGVTDVAPDGKRTPGLREELDYQVIATNYLPEPGWAVLKVTAKSNPEDRKC